MKLLVASNNEGKIKEIKSILSASFDKIVSIKDVGIHVDVIEDGDSFQANALKKAQEIFNACGGAYAVLADDSGLSVDALNGAPGVYSARYAGENATSRQMIEKLLNEMHNIPREQRKAQFVCCIALCEEGYAPLIAEGTVEGEISTAPAGVGGFGYDPVFYVEKYHATFAEISAEVKNTISHRANALRKMQQLLAERNK